MIYLTHCASLRQDGLASVVEMSYLCTVADMLCRRTVNDAICIGCGLVNFQRLRLIALNSGGDVPPQQSSNPRSSPPNNMLSFIFDFSCYFSSSKPWSVYLTSVVRNIGRCTYTSGCTVSSIYDAHKVYSTLFLKDSTIKDIMAWHGKLV